MSLECRRAEQRSIAFIVSGPAGPNVPSLSQLCPAARASLVRRSTSSSKVVHAGSHVATDTQCSPAGTASPVARESVIGSVTGSVSGSVGSITGSIAAIPAAPVVVPTGGGGCVVGGGVTGAPLVGGGAAGAVVGGGAATGGAL